MRRAISFVTTASLCAFAAMPLGAQGKIPGPPAAAPMVPGANTVKSISVAASSSSVSGACPLNMSFTGTITFARASAGRQVEISWTQHVGGNAPGYPTPDKTLYLSISAPGASVRVTDGPWKVGSASLNMPNMPTTLTAQDKLNVLSVNGVGANGQQVTVTKANGTTNQMTVRGGSSWGESVTTGSVTCK
ncbi:MAG TPA: hypothetical protein VHW65_08000 [Gemmatimonadales bacterium]|jgi:hypothetical protein|nr:hypothetical protein [Gemmatimonadales bacterium]